MRIVRIFMLIVLGMPMLSAGPQAKGAVVTLGRDGEAFVLLRDGHPFFIKGAGGSHNLDQLVAAGGNSIRTWSSSRQTLDTAQEKGLTVCVGLSLQKPRHGADYTDTDMLARQRDRIGRQVRRLKDHPALLMWGIGNEVEHAADPEDAIRVWKEIEILAQLVKSIDPDHPVITVIAGAGPKLADIRRLCPSLDAVGINSYGALSYVPDALREHGWDKPYLITEFGPRGWWEAPKTDWGLPIEQSSTEKARFYEQAYLAAIADQPQCLGSYIFLWGHKQEKTHTWFNMFLPDGTPTEMVDTMTRLWTGRWPDNRAPYIGDKAIDDDRTDPRHIYRPGENVQFAVDAADRENDPLTITWDLRKDVSDNPNIGGDPEPPTPPIDGAVAATEARRAIIRMPQEAGNYRLFVYVSDGSHKTATANVPVKVQPEER